MEAIVLAGGLGTRLREIISDLPKSMAPIAGHPFLEILLGNLEKKGFNRIIFSLGYKADIITKHFGSKFGNMELCYEVESSPLGTGGAIRASLMHCQGDHAFIFNGDTFLDLEVDQIEALWNAYKKPIIVAREIQDTQRYGQLCVESNRIIEFTYKAISGPGLINAGCYVLPRDALDSFELGHAFSLEKDFMSIYVKKTYVATFISKGFFIDIGIPSDYERAQIELLEFL